MSLNATQSCFQIGLTSTLCLLWLSHPTVAQIVPDATLPNQTITIPEGNTLRIEGGTLKGNNLFHSFQEFSVPSGSEAFFNNATNIQNIFSRVTGGKISQIDGLIRANGTANLFLLNPNGIIFGPNARLNIGGSFLASTANSFRFADGSEFSAIAPQAPPLLNINVPIGLQFGPNSPGSIQVQGSNLSVETGKTLALVGGDLTISGSNDPQGRGLTAGGSPFVLVQGNFVPTTPGGRIELWSVAKGQVSVMDDKGKLTLENGQGSHEFGNIQLLNAATIDTSGTGGGEIQVQGRKLQLTEGSRFLSFTLGDRNGGTMTVNASESVEIVGVGGYDQNVLRFVTGTVTPNDLRSGFFSVSFGPGKAGDIILNTPNFMARNGAYISTSTFAGEGGNITVNASDSVELSAAFIATGTGMGTAGNAGKLTINTQRFLAQDNGVLSTSSFGAGRGGDLDINASESVEIFSSNPIPFSPTARAFGGVFTSGLGTGDAGELHVSTRRLILRSGAALAASSFGGGKGGDLTINARESVELIGQSPDGQLLSAITSVTEPGSTGRGGNLTIKTDRVILRDGGRVSIRSRGTGDAGNLFIEANSILMDNQGGLEGTSESGRGGNFTVRSQTIQMRHNSFISATAGNEGGAGNGGNITLHTDTLAALENSDITANSVASLGGRVVINAKGIFGPQVRTQQTPESDITATGGTPSLNGTVQISTPNLETTVGLVALPENFVDVSTQIVAGCPADRGNRFVVTGRGGLPADPSQTLRGRVVWRDLRGVDDNNETILPNSVRNRANVNVDKQRNGGTITQSPMIEVTGWVMNARGQVELVTNASNVTLSSSWYPKTSCDR